MPAQHRRKALATLARAHADIYEKTTQVEVMRYGHAMAIPRPGTQTVLSRIGQPAMSGKRLVSINGERPQALPTPSTGRLHFAHSDLAAYSVFEEAFTLGHRVGLRLQSA